jgi:hypothetical protein
MPIIPATWDLQQRSGGLQFEASPGKKLARSLSQSKLEMVVHTCNLS